VHQLLVAVDDASKRMSRLVENLLELTHLQADLASLHLDRCDVHALALRLVRAIEPLTRMRGQHVQVDLPAGPLWITADAQRLERALFNLVENAQKYTPLGGHIALTAKPQAATVLISVSDDGPGIPADQQAHIFERFYRAEQTGRHAGSGLGLPIARAVVELHGGRLWVESAPGAGSAFYVALPVAPPAPAGSRGQPPDWP
jgi:signal transduction histidine kinase